MLRGAQKYVVSRMHCSPNTCIFGRQIRFTSFMTSHEGPKNRVAFDTFFISAPSSETTTSKTSVLAALVYVEGLRRVPRCKVTPATKATYVLIVKRVAKKSSWCLAYLISKLRLGTASTLKQCQHNTALREATTLILYNRELACSESSDIHNIF